MGIDHKGAEEGIYRVITAPTLTLVEPALIQRLFLHFRLSLHQHKEDPWAEPVSY